MNFSLTLPQLRTRSISAIKNDINDELEFHIQCRIDDLIEEGLTREAATAQAHADFGSTEAIRKQCEQISFGGPRLFAALSAIALTVLVSAVCWLSYQLVLVKNQNAEMVKRLSSVEAPTALVAAPAQKNLNDLTGTVTGPDGPVADAKVLLVFKSWPNNRYQQKTLATTTDDKGKFVFDDLYATNMQTAYLVSIVKDGLTLESKYWIHKSRRKVKPVRIRLKEAVDKVLTVRDPSGNLLPNTQVFLQSRNLAPNGESGDFIYPQSGKDILQTTDADGKVSMGYFLAGDKAKITAIVEDQNVDIEFKANDQREQSVGGKVKGDKDDVTGTVIGRDGSSIEGAVVLLVHKDWANGYRQNAYKTKTDAEGKFVFPNCYDASQKYAFLVSILGEGWAMESEYVVKQNGGRQDPFEFQMERATTKAFVFQDADGVALKRVGVFPRSRTNEGGDENLIYFQSGRDAEIKTDGDGKAQFKVFMLGDKVMFGFTDGGEVEVEVDDQAQQVVRVNK